MFVRGPLRILFRPSLPTGILSLSARPFATNPKFKVVEDPKEANKLVFEENGKCRIF